MRLQDPIERGEAKCEAWADEFVNGSTFQCACGRECSFDEAEPLSPDPYALPVCWWCAEAYWSAKEGAT